MSPIRIGLWDPFQMASLWLVIGGDPNHLLTGMILQVLLQCHQPFPKDVLTLRPQNTKKRIEKILKILVQPHMLPYIFSIWESFSKNQTNAIRFFAGERRWKFFPPWEPLQKQWSFTLHGINVSHLGKRKIIFKRALVGGYVSFQEGIRHQLQPSCTLKRRNPWKSPSIFASSVLPPKAAYVVIIPSTYGLTYNYLKLP